MYKVVRKYSVISNHSDIIKYNGNLTLELFRFYQAKLTRINLVGKMDYSTSVPFYCVWLNIEPE